MRQKHLTMGWQELPQRKKQEAFALLERHGSTRVPAHWVLDVAGEGSPLHRNILASDPATSPADLLFLLRAYQREVEQVIYANPSFPADLLMDALRHTDTRVVAAVARNPALPADGFRALYGENSREVLRGLLLNPRLPLPAAADIATRPGLQLYDLAISVIKQRRQEWLTHLNEHHPSLVTALLPQQVTAVATALRT